MTNSFLTQVSQLVKRNLIHTKRRPENLIDVTIQPIMFVGLFGLIFGGAIQTNNGSYIDWMIAGVMAQTMAFSSIVAAFGLATDRTTGFIDRLRSLPIGRPAVLVGRALSALLHSSIGISVMSLTGLVLGWRIHTSVLEALAGYGVLLLFGFAMIWVGIFVGSKLSTVEAVNGVMFSAIFPITFVANSFAPTENMPVWLRTVAEWNPLSAVVQAVRELWGNAPAVSPEAAWPLQHPVIMALAWSALIIAVLAPLAVRQFYASTTH